MGMAGVGGVVGEKSRQLYLKNNTIENEKRNEQFHFVIKKGDNEDSISN